MDIVDEFKKWLHYKRTQSADNQANEVVKKYTSDDVLLNKTKYSEDFSQDNKNNSRKQPIEDIVGR